MKSKIILIVAIVAAFMIGAAYNSRHVEAQSIGAGPVTSTTLAGCPAPATGAMNFCLVTNDPSNATGVYLTANGAAYFQIKAAGAAGVATFNGRSGNVIPATGDYSFGMVSGQVSATQLPTTLTCTVTLNVTGSSQKATLSSCN